MHWPAREWQARLDRNDAVLQKRLGSIYGDRPALISRKKGCLKKCLKAFAGRFGEGNTVYVERVPAKLNVLGSHVDHRGSPTNAIAIDREILICFEPTDKPEIHLADQNPRFGERRIAIPAPQPEKLDSLQAWLDYTQALTDKRKTEGTHEDWEHKIAAVPHYLRQMVLPGSPLNGFRGIMLGDIPPGCGLSSSSALVVGMFDILNAVNVLNIEPGPEVIHCGLAEWYVGTRGGAGDHAGIKFSRCNQVTALRTVPVLKIEGSAPFPKASRIIIFDSGVMANKTGGAKNTFNEKVAVYEIGELFLAPFVEKRYPGYIASLKKERKDLVHVAKKVCMADLSRRLKKEEILEFLLSLPASVTRRRLEAQLPARRTELSRLFETHEEPAEGYALRAVMAYGVSEIERSTSLLGMLNSGKFAPMAEFLNVSHDGDRVRNIAERVRENKEVPDAHLRGFTGPLTRLAGDYHCSHPDIDDMADIALKSGAAAARILGAGLGGSLMALVELDAVDRVVRAMQKEYYSPRKIESTPIVALPVQGACLV